MIRAFLVDDEPPARVRLRQLLLEAGGVVVVGEASNADEARGGIVDTHPDVVFLDIEMPEERGTELAASLPEPRPFIVFATAFDRYAVDAFAVAATDFLLKPVTRARLAGTLARVREQLTRQSDLERELAAASATQAYLFARTLPAIAGFDCAATTVPARAVGGDFYLAQPLRNGRFGLALGDVAGKGVPAGLVASGIQARLETLGRLSDVDAGNAIADLNGALIDTIEIARFATLAYVEVAPGSDRLRVVNAGHPPLVAVNTAGGHTLIAATGPALGVLRDARFAITPIDLAAGDVLVAYSDGLTEADDSEGAEYGERRLVQTILRHRALDAAALCHTLVRDVRAFRAGAPASDDVTVMVIKRLSA